MAKDRDDEQQNYSLEEILAEFGSGHTPPAPPRPEKPKQTAPKAEKKAPSPDPEEGRTVPLPSKQQKLLQFPTQELPDLSALTGKKPRKAAETPKSVETPPPVKKPRGEPAAAKAQPKEKVISFPGEVDEPTTGLKRLMEKADAFSREMFRDEGVEVSDETRRIERLVPGVDEEAPPPPPSRKERKIKKEPPPLPDLPPNQLAGRYGKGLALLRLRGALILLLALPQLWISFAPLSRFPLPASLAEHFQLQVWLCGGLLALGVLLGIDIVVLGLVKLFLGKPGGDTLTAIACLVSLADAFTPLMPERVALPYCAVCTLSLFFAMRGTYHKRRGLRLSCRTAAAASNPYVVTVDKAAWDGKDAYAKSSGSLEGFGSQIQEPDGSERVYRVAAPLLLIAGVLCALIVSVGRGQSERFLWCLSANLTAVAGFSSLLTFARPFRKLALRLSASGAALAGWSGAAEPGRVALLTDTDLFPPGTVALNGIKVFGDFSVEKVVSVCATMVRASGSGLDKVFHDLVRSQGTVYRRCTNLVRHEAGGLSGDIREEHVLVGSASFMALKEVPLPPGLNVRNAVFCAIDGELAGIFALNYVLHGTISPALVSLILNKVSPVLCTRDFNLIPAMLRQKFKLPVERMDFPGIERRAELSDPEGYHNDRITAVLCREGLGPYAEAVVGAKRLGRAVRLSTAVAVLGSVVGLLLSFYLTYSGAQAAIGPAQLAVFQTAWLVPTVLISGWVNRY